MINSILKFLKKHPSLLSVLSGILLFAGWPPFFAPLLLVAFVPLLWAVDKAQNIRKAFYYSFIAFFIRGILCIHWAAMADLTLGGYLVLFIFGYGLMAFLMTLPLLLFKWVQIHYSQFPSPLGRAREGLWASLPVFWVAYEFLHSKWDLSFMWLHLGLGLSKYPVMIQFYEITGMLGGSALIIIVNVLIYLIIKSWYEHKNSVNFTGDNGDFPLWMGGKKTVFAAGLLFFLLFTTFFFNSFLSTYTNGREKVRIAILQPNADSYKKLDSNTLNERLELLKKMIEPLREKQLDLVVCPEGFFKGAPSVIINDIDSSDLGKKLKKISTEMNCPVVTGFIGFRLIYSTVSLSPSSVKINTNGRKVYYEAFNAAMMITPDNMPIQITTKTQLVPFMERVPFLDLFSFLENLHLPLNQMPKSYGKEEPLLLKYKNMRIAVPVCQESIYPDYVRTLIQKDANIIAVVTDDGWTGTAIGAQQHSLFSAPLAIETGKFIARSANTGISQLTDIHGNISQQTKFGQQQVVIAIADLIPENTIYVKYGNVIGWGSLLLTGFFMILFFSMRFFYVQKLNLKHSPGSKYVMFP